MKVNGVANLIESCDLASTSQGELHKIPNTNWHPGRVGCGQGTQTNIWNFLHMEWLVLSKHLWWEKQPYFVVKPTWAMWNKSQKNKKAFFTRIWVLFHHLWSTWCLKRELETIILWIYVHAMIKSTSVVNKGDWCRKSNWKLWFS